VKDVHTVWGGFWLGSQLTCCQDLHQIGENDKIRKEKTNLGFGEIIFQRQRVQDTLEEKLGAIGCESGNVEVQRNSIKECVTHCQ